MNLRVTQHAGLEKARLVVERRRSRRPAKAGLRVTLQAEQVDIAQFQHVRIRPAMHQVAGLTTIYLHRLVFEDEWPLLVGVALEANLVLARGRAHLVRLHGAMRVVTVGALDEPFVHPMMERHVELRLL